MSPIPILLVAIITAASAAPLLKERIVGDLRAPMGVAIAPNGDLFVAEREGRILRVNPQTGGVFELGTIQVQSYERSRDYAREDGMLSITLDPNFPKNQRIYIYYSAREVVANRLSRFTLKDGSLDPASELKLLEIPTSRTNAVSHQGSTVLFGPDGLLYVSTGDNTSPFESSGYAPIDDRDGREDMDAQRSAGNTNDLRGKILRIKPNETGYEIPDGNLFPKGRAKTRPEIYIMGCRSPFRISIDPKNSFVYWGDVGPDARANSSKGPQGYDEVNEGKKAGNFGWPFVIANNQPYPIVDFATNTVGRMTDPGPPENHGQRNTGLTVLPPAQPDLVWYPYDSSKEFPALGKGGRAAMAGPVFYFDPARKMNLLGKEDDHTLLGFEYMRGQIFKVKLSDGEAPPKLEVIMDRLMHPLDLKMDRDGSLVLLEFGTGADNSRNGELLRIRADDGNKRPTLTIKPTESILNSYSVDEAVDPENGKITVIWYVTDGVTEREIGNGSSVMLPSAKFQDIRAVAINEKGARGFARIASDPSKDLPQLTLEIVNPRKEFNFGDTVNFIVASNIAPEAKEVVVRARYIAPTGHDTIGPEFSGEALKIAKANLCLACHQVDTTSAGPAYLDVSMKYRGQKDAPAYLKNKITQGGGGVWGKIAMPPQITIEPADLDKVIAAILGLSQGMSETKGTLKGALQLAPKVDLESGGAWEITAAAPGYSQTSLRINAK